MQTLTWLRRPKYNYNGVIVYFKGDPNAQAAEASTTKFDQMLMSTFQAQYGQQQGIINYLKNLVTPIINKGGQGASPAALAAERTSSTDTVTNQFKNAQVAANAAAVRTGGSELPSGVSTMIESSLAPAQAEAQAQGQNAITLADENLKQQNYWNAINVLNGQSAALNPLGYAELPLSGGNTVANLSNANTSANGPTAGQILGGIAGGALGAAGTIFGGSFAKGGAFA